MNILHQAYSVLGLSPGASLPSILRRYRRLAMVWHPDRMPTEDGKQESTEELKKINEAKELLTKHHQSQEHCETGPCDCRAADDVGGNKYDQQTRRTSSASQGEQSKTVQPTAEQAYGECEQSERLRWQLAQYAAVAYISLFSFSFLVNCVKHIFIH